MSPLRITSDVPVSICARERELSSAGPSSLPYDAEGTVYVRPCEKGPDYTVKVTGFHNEPGGMLESERLTPGHNLDELTLTTPEDIDLMGELGLSEVTIDGVRYTALNPLKK